MGVNQVVLGSLKIMDITDSTVTPETLISGATAYDKAGDKITGTAEPQEDLAEELGEQDDLIDRISAALVGKAAGDGKPEQEKTVEINENGTYEIVPDEGFAMSKVTATVNVAGGEADPSEQYQRVEYITSAAEGTYPYMITDVYADNGTGIEVVASFPSVADRIPMGSREDTGSTRFYCTYPLSTSSCYYGFNTGSSISCSTKVNTVYRLQTNFMNSRQAIVYEKDGTRKAFGNFTQTLSKHTAPIAIFGYNSASSGAVTSKREYKLYSARLSEGFDVIREYVPCYRKSDGVVGLYEKFTGQFLTNADDSGNSSFVAGAAIDW